MKIAMIGIISNPVLSNKSHNGGWTLAMKSLLETRFELECFIEKDESKFNEYDILVINEGVNYRSGSYNFFGGVQNSTIKKIEALSNYNGKVYTINEIFDFNDLFSKRKELNVLEGTKMPEVNMISSSYEYETKKLIIGDSHSISVYKPGYSISRNDGKTLYRFLKNNKNKYFEHLDDLIVYFGNIDVRFHLPRQKNPIIATRKLALEYVDWCFKTKAKPVCLLPVETEERKIPKTGQYKGENFFGSRSLRRSLVKEFNDILQAHFLDCYTWPEKWYDVDYDFTQEMELRQSVHLRPESYMNYDNISIKPVSNNLTLF